MATGYFEYDITTPVTITQHNVVGPTADISFRANSDLPNTNSGAGSKNDANTIYLDASGGNDGNSGFTLALAKKTWLSATAAITPTRYTIHIETTDPVNYSEFSVDMIGTPQLFNDLKYIQVAAGQTAKVIFNNGYHTLFAPTNALVFNGVEFYSNHTTPMFGLLIDKNITLEWIKWTAPRSCILAGAGCNTLTFDRCIFISKEVSTAAESSSTLDFSQTDTLVGYSSIFVNSGTVSGGLAIGQNSQALTLDFKHCNFINYKEAVQVSNGVTSFVTTNNHSHIFHHCEIAIKDRSTPTPSSLIMPISNSLVNVGNHGMADFTTSGTSLFNANPLFLDEDLLDFKLVHIGRIYNNINYPINSPAVGLSADVGKDGGAWDFTYTEGTETFSTLTLPAGLSYDNVKLATERTNYQQYKNLLGQNFSTWDAIRHRITLEIPNNYWLGHDFSYDLLNMFATQGTKRFFPAGAIGLLEGTHGWDWVGFAADGALEIDILSLPRGMRVNAYRGWVVKLGGTVTPGPGGVTGYYRVRYNTVDSLFVDWYRGYEFVSDIGLTEGFANIQYLPVLVDMSSIELISEMYTENEKKGWYRSSTEAEEDLPDAVSEFHTRSIILLEA